ncbi:unnamed protein product [Caretta caretta]
METDGTQQQVPSEDSEVMLLLKLVLKEALEQKQQQRILGPYLEELFDAHHEELSTVERVAVTEGTEASHEPEYLWFCSRVTMLGLLDWAGDNLKS